MQIFVILFALFFALSSFAETSLSSKEKWTKAKDLNVSESLCLPQSVAVLKKLGVDNIEIGTMITRGNYQANKVSVFCEPHGDKSRFLVAVEGSNKDVVSNLGNLILNDRLIGSDKADIKLGDIENNQLIKSKIEAELSKYVFKVHKDNPVMSGSFGFRVVIGTSGQVTEITILKNESNSAAPEKELRDLLGNAKFPSPTREIIITREYTFVGELR